MKSKELGQGGDGRWIIRAKNGDRLGAILGTTGCYRAQTARGVLVGQVGTLAAAIALLKKGRR